MKASARRTCMAGVAALAVALGLSATTLSAPATATNTDPVETPLGPETVTMVQANIYTGLSADRFQADARKVQRDKPDFITYNEVMFRQDMFLAPPGYAMYRSMANRFTAEAPVAWRTDRWSMVDSGTMWISTHRGRPPGKEIELGRRAVNWVTLTSPDGRVLSVVSAHIAPLTRGMPDLLRPSMVKLGGLVDQLAQRGPVLVGGDFNVEYTAGRYPRDLTEAAGMVPTYDTMGAHFPTGDHGGHTIDYLFNRGEGQLVATSQHPMELRSDHDAVVGGFTWQVDPPVATSSVVSVPTGTEPERRLAVSTLRDAIGAVPEGSTIALRAGVLGLRGPVASLRKALDRGVHLDVVTANDEATRPERRLARFVLESGDPESRVLACGSLCFPTWRDAGMKQVLVMVGDADGTWTRRYDLNRALDADAIEQATTARTSRGPIALREGAAVLALGG